MKSIGVIGKGFVGGTLCKVLEQMPIKYELKIFDLNPNLATHPEQETMACDVVFVCVPTPMILETGDCYTDFVRQVVAKIRTIRDDNWVVIKSTVPPGTTQSLDFSYGRICFNPEFLTEANAYQDFISLPYQIIGVCCDPPTDAYPVAEIFLNAFSHDLMKCAQIYYLPATDAEMIKYIRNTYLATRLSFFNEIKQICDKLSVNFNQAKWFAGLDERVGQHYNRIDEDEPEFSGSCLVKDINALIYLAKKLDIDPKLLNGVWEKNLEVAKKRTWETLLNRAVLKK